MTGGVIRAVAIVALRDGDRVLLGEIVDRVTGAVFWRAPGGAIEFGEPAIDAAAREIREELGIEVDALRQIGIIENRFEFEGKPGHEIVFVFEGRWPEGQDAEACASGTESDGSNFVCRWVAVDEMDTLNIVPPGFVGLIAASRTPVS